MNKNLTFLNPPYNNDKYNMLTSSHHPINNEILQSLAKEENFSFWAPGTKCQWEIPVIAGTQISVSITKR